MVLHQTNSFNPVKIELLNGFVLSTPESQQAF
jgi:hypothetical protein